jgi:transcription elongation factor B subunit 1
LEGRGEIEFPEISTPVLEKVLQYCHYKLKYNASKVPVPDFAIPPDMALELLMAANYLDC